MRIKDKVLTELVGDTDIKPLYDYPTIKDIQDFVSETEIIFWGTGLKMLTISVGYSNYTVYSRSSVDDEWEMVYIGVQPYPAIEKYNSI